MKKSIRILLLVVLVAVFAIILTGKPQSGNPSADVKSDASGIVTRAAGREKTDPELEARRKRSIDLAAQKWYEELLEKYPDMKPVYRDVPDEKNGYLQLLQLAESMEKPPLDDELKDMISGAAGEWDAGKFKAWQSENQWYFDELLRIAELPDRSTKGIAMDRIFGAPARYGSVFGSILRASARVAFENGDQETALRHLKASTAIGDHIVDTEVTSMLGEVISVGIRNSARDLLQVNFLPVLANDPESLSRWNEVVFRNEKPAAEYARVIAGEWNASIRSLILPALLGDPSAVESLPVGEVHDVEELLGSYTRMLQQTAEGIQHSGSDRFDVERATDAFPPAESLVNRTGEESHKVTAEGMLMSLRGLPVAFGKSTTRTAMASAAISILLGEEPPVDPVSGEAFVWNAETRTLSAPGDGEEFEPIVVPGGH
ncbi:hypothetical protein JIN84_20670 [Luteolibacter yonseiensis]|uniref:Uncharacterized protein n=1 Tax=Luteolibacter yonseiensis TaxID=1144680 RepID=A0A934VDY5_9BACT|nr:hypothetical protein [Luteolibacter yonseiensis]MBK1818049.1 hypothetical protein [Luteolibacter yonseiensis]